MMNKFHQFHMVSMSPWPMLTSFGVWAMAIQTAFMISKSTPTSMVKTVCVVSTMSTLWWLDSVKESKKEGEHPKMVSKGLKMGMLMFIASEVLFFFSFFWCYFHSSMSPSAEMGQMWPPKTINSFNPVNVPLLNTLILISSGVSVTWAHHSIMKNDMNKVVKGLSTTTVLGLYFTYLQYLEYTQAGFSMSDSSYGSIFFMATGFHGLHVMIGTTFLLVNLVSIKMVSVSMSHHNSFEMAAWYWHFVDVVWLALYLSVYWWGK